MAGLTEARRAVAAQLERVPLLRWFLRALPGRLSAVFLLAAAGTLGALLYAGPRLEQSLIAPRERSAEASLRVGVFLSQQFAAAGIAPQAFLPTVEGAVVGTGVSPQRFALFQVLPSGRPDAPIVQDIQGSQRPSRVVRRLARLPPGRRLVAPTSVDNVPRVEAAQVIQSPTGGTLVVSVWQSTADIERTVEIARNRILIAGIGGASIALLLGVWVTTRLTRRIRQLEAGARKVAQGDFTARFRGEGSLELASLGRALDEMQRQLAELESARRRFIATASHELRTPLSTLQGYLELLENEQLPPERRREFVMHASDQAQRLGKLASDLLDLSRLDVGAVQVKRAPTDVGMLLEGLVMEFRVSAERHGSVITRSVDPRAETALIDADRVLQVLRALVQNALTHTPGGTSIAIAARRTGARIAFTVADDGPGIDPARSRDLFEPFVTADETRGSGLGLAIGRELARRMHGDLSVTSAPGDTVFTLSLPA